MKHIACLNDQMYTHKKHSSYFSLTEVVLFSFYNFEKKVVHYSIHSFSITAILVMVTVNLELIPGIQF